MLLFNLVAIVCNNGYLLKMGFKPYSSRLISQAVWILGLIAFYIVINMHLFSLSLLQKIVIYVVIVGFLGLYFLVQKKKMEADKNVVLTKDSK